MSYLLPIFMALAISAGSALTSPADHTASPAQSAQTQEQGKLPYDCKAPCSVGDPDCVCGTDGK
jgi:hypothetical protein